MSSRVPHRLAADQRVRVGSRFFRTGRNQLTPRPVVQGVGKRRGVGAALLAAGLVLSGCASGEDEVSTTTTSALAEGPTNPWDLPLEQRPPLFDPCEEIPVEAVEEGVGSPLQSVEDLTNYEPGELISCGWRTDEIRVGTLSTWKSRGEYLEDRGFVIRDSAAQFSGRSGIRMVSRGDHTDGSCYALFFTSRGTVWMNVKLVNSLNTFNGKRFSKACDVLNEIVAPIIPYIPNGEFS